ncbi:MAG TPA: hypothetical protein VK994_06910, partial [Bacteroidales bacterium]|nr:hypothetical protein [Bacteroidales bacterium]
ENKGSAEDTRIWHFAFYNKDLQQQWLADTALIDGAKFHGHARNDKYTFLFFLDKDRIRSSHNMQILVIDYPLNVFRVLDVMVPEKAQPLKFEIIKNRAVIGFNNSTFEPRISIIDLENGNVSTAKPELEGLNIFQEIKYNSKEDKIYVVVDNYIGKKQNALLVLKMTADGQVIQKMTIDPAIEGKVLNEARIAFIHGDTLLVLGTYHGDPSRLKTTTEDTGPESAGYFAARFISDRQDAINYYNFLEFEEMYRSLSSKTIADLRRKAEKQKSRGEEYSLDYTLLLHDIIEMNDNYVLLSEAFYPEYRTVTNMYYDYYGRPIPQTYTVFDGYKYISGIAAAFTSGGELLWDNGIEMPDIITFNLGKYLGNFVSGEELALFYGNENKVFYQMTGGENIGGASQSITLENSYKGDKVMEDLGSRMIHWYDNYFLCYGYQKIRNNRLSESKRTIFYFNKLAFK